MVSATRLQRPMARTNPSLDVTSWGVAGIGSLYHKLSKRWEGLPDKGLSRLVTFARTKVTKPYESACPWDIYSRGFADEMLVRRTRMAIEDMDDLHLRIARVTDDLRTIQQELNCAAMQAPSDPELMEALNSLSETEPIETLRVALDQMRHFLWFYSEVMNNDPELGDKLRQAGTATAPSDDSPKTGKAFLDQLSRVDELMLLHHLTEAKRRKPN
jgi:hypothetical protein